MFSPFICGSFHHQEEDDFENSPCSTPKRSKRSGFCRSNRDSKNPYANRGLDKFSALLADLEDKKQKIYTQLGGSEDISFVRFVYSNSNDVKPIVVKVKERKEDKTGADNVKDKHTTRSSDPLDKHTVESPKGVSEVQQQLRADTNHKAYKKKKKNLAWNFKLENFRKPSYYFPLIIVLILVFLAIYGRSFAILCTSIGWYLIPTIKAAGAGSSSTRRVPKRKKEYVRRMSEKHMVSDGMSSPRSVINGPVADRSPRQNGHRGSW